MAKLFFKTLWKILNDIKPTIEYVDIVFLQQLFDQENKMTQFTRRQNVRYFCLLDELIKFFLFLFPFLDFEKMVNPLWGIAA